LIYYLSDSDEELSPDESFKF